jgi:hypothetical protein
MTSELVTSREMGHEIYGEVTTVNVRRLCKTEARTVAQGEAWEWGLETREEATAHLS